MKNITSYFCRAMVTLAIVLLFTQCSKPMQKEIGLQLYSIREQVSNDLPEALKQVSLAGYSFVEAAGYNDGLFYNLAPTDFATLCQSFGLDFLSSHINGPDPNTNSAEECEQWWKKAIEAHKEAGVAYIVQPSMRSSAYDSLPGLMSYIKLFDKVGSMCKAEGIQFGYHNHNHEFTTLFEGKPMYDWMLENSNPENLFFQLDVYWSQVGGCPAVEYLERYPGRFTLWHIKDVKEVGASGTIDFAAIYALAQKSGMRYAIIEQEDFTLPPYESIKASNDFLQNADYVNASYSSK